MKLFYGWVIVGVGMVVTCVARPGIFTPWRWHSGSPMAA